MVVFEYKKMNEVSVVELWRQVMFAWRSQKGGDEEVRLTCLVAFVFVRPQLIMVI